MADIQEIYSILLSRRYQEQLFSSLPGGRKKEKGGRETLVDCPFCGKAEHFSYSSDKPLWKCWHCGEGGDWIKYLEKTRGYDFLTSLQELAGAAGVDLSPHIQANYQTYVRKADILEAAQKYFMDTLQDKDEANPVYAYLSQRGYTFDEIYDMELGAYLDRESLQAELQKQGYTAQEIQSSGLLTPGFGEDYQLTLLWRDQAGRAIGIAGRAILSDQELRARGLSKYKYSAGLQKDQGLVGFSSSRGSPQIVLLEGVLDALYLNYKGFRSVAVGGLSLSAAQIQALTAAGTKELLLAMDMDEAGQRATEKILSSLSSSGLRAYVVSWSKEHKDPDELIRRRGAQAFQEALDKAERASKWLARRIVSKHDLTTDRGLDRALEESLEAYQAIEDKIDQRAFMDSLKVSTGLSEEDLAVRLQEASERASSRKSQAVLQNYLREIQQKAAQGDIAGAELELSKALREVRISRGVEAPDPYLLDDFLADIQTTPPALTSGYKRLDDTAGIPVGAITIIAGRPGQGKTTFQLNLLVNMIRAYPDRRFYFFSYEEARKVLAVKLLMILAGETLSATSNYGAYVNYLKEKRGTNPKIDRAIREYEELTSSGRLLVSDDMYPAEDLASVISRLTRSGDTGAVIVDYIQRIPLLRPSQGQRYLEIKQVSALLLEQAARQDIPVILGAQLGRGQGIGSRVRLDNLRESGDIEQDASLVLGLYTEAIENIEAEDYRSPTRQEPEVDIEVSVLKNRGGIAGKSHKLTFNRPILTITDKS